MKRLILITLIMSLAAAGMAAQQYYQFPTAKRVYDDARILAFNNASGNRNITGLQLKQEIAAFARLSTSKRVADASQIFNLMTTATATKLVKRAAANAGDYDRVMEIRDKTGKVVYYVQANGSVTFGTPVPLSIATVYPANGATNVSNGTWFNYSSSGGGWARINTTTPVITFSKSRISNVSISNTYIVGSSIAPLSDGGKVYSFINFSGAKSTTYTMRVNRSALTQTDGESTHSCGSAMTDIGGGICQSTFTMK